MKVCFEKDDVGSDALEGQRTSVGEEKSPFRAFKKRLTLRARKCASEEDMRFMEKSLRVVDDRDRTREHCILVSFVKKVLNALKF